LKVLEFQHRTKLEPVKGIESGEYPFFIGKIEQIVDEFHQLLKDYNFFTTRHKTTSSGIHRERRERYNPLRRRFYFVGVG
jgi:hypothetical protein